MTRPLSEKYNDSCVTMFKFLQLLISGEASYKNVLKLFKEHYGRDDSNPHVMLNKFQNTLKIFGIQVQKNNNHFYIQSLPYKIDLNEEDLKAAEILKTAVKMLPDGKQKILFEQFFADLELYYNESTQKLADSMKPGDNKKCQLFSAELSEQIKQCELCCETGYKLNITYINKNNWEEHLTFCSPVELKYYKRKICFCVYAQNRITEIPLDRIKIIEQLPTQAPNSRPTTTVIFRLKGKLVKTYRLKDGETLKGIEPDGSLIIINKDEDFDVLLKRLMRYGSCCEVISPKVLRERMIEMIEEALKYYDE